MKEFNKISGGSNEMDKVQRFIYENQHQLGYIMGEASRSWIENDPVGALTVGDCNVVVRRHGEYHQLLEKVEFYQKVLTDISNSPKVRGIGPLEDSLNGMITKAEKAIEHFNQ